MILKWGRESEQVLFQRRYTEGQQVYEKVLDITNDQKMKIKLSYYLTPVTMAILKKTTDGKYQQECGEKGTLVHCWQDCKFYSAATMENNMDVPQKIKNRATYDPAITLLGIYPKDIKTGY